MSSTIIKINPQYSQLEEYINSIATNGVQAGELIYNARNKIYCDTVQGVAITIKCFKVPSLFNRIIYTFFRKSKAHRSFENATKLSQIGIGTPTPVAYIEQFKDGILEKTYYICLMIYANDIRRWDLKLDSENVVARTAQFIAQLHEKGVFHKDFSPGNILYDKYYNFYLIDINRMKFGVINHKVLMNNFKCLHDSPDDTAQIASLYAKCISGDERQIVKEALAARQAYKDGQARKRQLKRLFKKAN